MKAIFFDFDDTLVRTYQVAYRKHCNTARKLNLRIPSEKEYLSFYGLPWSDLITGLWPSVQFEDFKQVHVQEKNEDYDAVFGVNETLNFLNSKKLFLGLLTTRDKFSFNLVAQYAKINLNYFSAVLTRTNTNFHKPDPRVFDSALNLLSNHGIGKQETVYVGDSIYDFLAAHRAGLNFIGVLTGPTSKEVFLDSGLSSENIIPSVHELISLLKTNSWI